MSSLLFTETNFTNQNGEKQRKYAYIDVTKTVRPVHSYFESVNYLFDLRYGADWNYRLRDYRDGIDRTQIGQTDVAEFVTEGNCENGTCKIVFRGSNQMCRVNCFKP